MAFLPTRQSMANYLFGGDDSQFRGDTAEQESNEDVASILAHTHGAISYLGTAYLKHRCQIANRLVSHHLGSPPFTSALPVATCSSSAESFRWTSMT
jgi:ABC-type phosphate transport system substrate-binding protein